MLPERLEKIENLTAARQLDLAVILENVHDPHNINACIRTCDAIGVTELYVLYSDPAFATSKFKPGKRTSSGAKKWVDTHIYFDLADCFKEVRSKYDRVLASHVTEGNKELHELDLTGSIALLFGNEHLGVSDRAVAASDGTFFIPQVGMVESLNLSVACAVTLYEAYRQRDALGYYKQCNKTGSPEQFSALLDKYLSR